MNDPKALSDAIGFGITSSLIGLTVGLVGAVVVMVALLGCKNREPWFFGTALILSLIWSVLVFPYGVIVGVLVGGAFIMKRNDFRAAREVRPQAD